jgi:hypothetical protein
MHETMATVLYHSTPDTTADLPLPRVAWHVGPGGQGVRVPALPPLSRWRRLISWLGILVCRCPACCRASGQWPDLAWHDVRS